MVYSRILLGQLLTLIHDARTHEHKKNTCLSLRLSTGALLSASKPLVGFSLRYTVIFEKLLSTWEFRENPHCDSRTLSRGVNKFLPLIFI